MSIAVYYRVSSDQQDVAAQRHAVNHWLAARGITDVVVYQDKMSGKRDDRPDFMRLCADVAAKTITAVVVYRLDRVSRNAVTALQVLLDWMRAGVEFFAVDQPILMLGKDNPMRLTITALFSELAQLEREAIVARVRSGMAAAKARGVKLGKAPSLTETQILLMKRSAAEGAKIQVLATRYGISRATVYRYLQKAAL